MKSSSHTIITAAVLALSAAGTAPRTGGAQEFSADIVKTPQRAGESAKVYVGASKIRLEQYENGQPQSGAIWDQNAQAMTILIDAQHAYIGGSNTSLVSKMMTQSGAPPIWRIFHPNNGGDPCTSWNSLMQSYATAMHDTTPHPVFSCRSLGSEAVNGRAASKWAVTSTDRTGRKDNGTVWIDSRLHIVSKSQDSTGTMELKNVQEGPQPASVFAIPAGYHPLDIRQMMSRMNIPGADSLAAALGQAAKDVGNDAASNTATAAKTQATNGVTKKLKGILRLP